MGLARRQRSFGVSIAFGADNKMYKSNSHDVDAQRRLMHDGLMAG